MNRLTRWNPFREMLELRNEMDRLFEGTFPEPQLRRNVRMTWGPALDVIETEEAFVVKASVPGIAPDDLDITLVDNVLTIKGQRQAEELDEGEIYHLQEHSYGAFSRSITLPVSVEADEVQAQYDNGILHLFVPKTEEVRPRRIPVNVQSSGQKALEGELVQ
ncbi:MAG: Hsp20/alpha crystallin family protein [Chloroflexota bacterium]